MRRAVVALALLAGCGGDEEPVAAPVPTGTATVQQRDLTEAEDVPGTLRHAGARTVGAAAAGTVTRLREEGEVVPLGRSLYSVDREPSGFVLHGDVPAWRALRLGVGDGPDVRQLERALARLGHDPGTVDDAFTGATAAAVRAWEDARGSDVDGVVEPSEVVVVAGTARAGRHRAEVGDAVRPGAPVLEVTRRAQEVVAALPASRQADVRAGARVEVVLPDGEAVRGRVTEVGRVARAGQEGAEATVELRVAVRATGLDGAPVTVEVPVAAARGVLCVPVEALVAIGAGRYALERAGDGRRVPVEVGRVVGGFAEVRGVPAGTRVVVPA
jgi:peptidoglycan hydrolase-like protein with peptidoglycan-binding domain